MPKPSKIPIPPILPILPSYLPPIPLIYRDRRDRQHLNPSLSSSSSSSKTTSSPKFPFFRDPQHVIPTLHLYRDLLRCFGPLKDPKYPSLLKTLRKSWKKWKKLTSYSRVQAFLEKQSSIIQTTSQFSSSDLSNSLIKPLSLEELEKAAKQLSNDHLNTPNDRQSNSLQPKPRSPRMTGGYLRPTSFNGPLPRLKPQPIGITMMIHNRLRARERRIASRRRCVEELDDIRAEMGFWRELAGVELQRQARELQRNKKGKGQSRENVDEYEYNELGEEENLKIGLSANGIGIGSKSTSKSKRKDEAEVGIGIKMEEKIHEEIEWLVGWESTGRAWLRMMDEAFDREAKRAEMKFTIGQVMRIENAKKRRLEWKRAKAEAKKHVQ